MNIGFIGIGVMGRSMAGHLAKAGHTVYAYNRSADKAEAFAKEFGGVFCATIEECVKNADAVISIVGMPYDVKEVYLGEKGILNCAKKGAIAIDMTTSSPTLAAEIWEKGKEKGIDVLDAPVSGGDSGAKNATLSIMVGGDEAVFEKVKPLFEIMGKNIVYMGKAGSGQHTKAANQIAVAGATAAMTEAIVYAEDVGLDPHKMLEAIGAGAAGSWQLSNMAPRVLKEDFAPGFFVKHFIKDMKIVVEEAEKRGDSLKMLSAVLSMYEEMAQKGLENDGTQALIKLYKNK